MRRLILLVVAAPILLSLSGCTRTCAAEHVSLTMLSADPSLLLPGNNQTIGVHVANPASSDSVHVTARFYAPGYNVPGIPPTIAEYSFPAGRLTAGGVNDTEISWDLGALAPGRAESYYVTVTAPPALGAFGLDAKAYITVTSTSPGACTPAVTDGVVLKDPTSGGE
jgi:hypothetical protein